MQFVGIDGGLNRIDAFGQHPADDARLARKIDQSVALVAVGGGFSDQFGPSIHQRLRRPLGGARNRHHASSEVTVRTGGMDRAGDQCLFDRLGRQILSGTAALVALDATQVGIPAVTALSVEAAEQGIADRTAQDAATDPNPFGAMAGQGVAIFTKRGTPCAKDGAHFVEGHRVHQHTNQALDAQQARDVRCAPILAHLLVAALEHPGLIQEGGHVAQAAALHHHRPCLGHRVGVRTTHQPAFAFVAFQGAAGGHATTAEEALRANVVHAHADAVADLLAFPLGKEASEVDE